MAALHDTSTANLTGAEPVVPYEQRLSQSISYVLDEGGRLFVGTSEVNKTLQRITKRLDELGIPYAVAGGLALIAHGFRRFTEDIDIVVTREGLAKIHEHLDGRGWVRPFSTSKNLRDTDNGVRVEFLIAGDYPGDGKPKPVSFPQPQEVGHLQEGVNYVDLPTFVNLKLASGMTNEHRGKDLVDVEQLIQSLSLGKDFAGELAPYVQAKYLELWRKYQVGATRFLASWDTSQLAVQTSSLTELLAADDSPLLRQLANDGVEIDLALSTAGTVILYTDDRQIAAKYQMVDSFEVDMERLRNEPINKLKPSS